MPYERTRVAFFAVVVLATLAYRFWLDGTTHTNLRVRILASFQSSAVPISPSMTAAITSNASSTHSHPPPTWAVSNILRIVDACRRYPEVKPGFVWMRAMKVGSTSTYEYLKQVVEKRSMVVSPGVRGQDLVKMCTDDGRRFREGTTPQWDVVPNLVTHIGFRKCWLQAVQADAFVLFSMRDPVERLVSAYMHGGGVGIKYGLSVRYNKIHPPCDGRDNMTRTLTQYAEMCPHATNNLYVQMWDPITENVDVAIDNFRSVIDKLIITDLSDFGSSIRILKAALCDLESKKNSSTVVRHLNKAAPLFIDPGKQPNPENAGANNLMSLKNRLIHEARTSPLLQKYLAGDMKLYEIAIALFKDQQRHYATLFPS